MAMQLEIPACQRTELLGIPLDNVTLAEAVATIVERLDGPLPQQVCFVNADCVNIAFRHPQYLDALRRADLVFADGIGLKLAGMALGSPVRDNVNGTDLFPRLCEALSGTGKSLYLLGARPGVVDDLCVWIASHYPGVAIAGSRHGYFSADEEPAVIEAIADSGADLVLVAFGAPVKSFGSNAILANWASRWPSAWGGCSTSTRAGFPAHRGGCVALGWSGFTGFARNRAGCGGGMFWAIRSFCCVWP